MITSSSPVQTATPGQKAWAAAIANPATEFAPTDLGVLAGQVPTGLRGTLYRNGPARLERDGIRVSHWFDGDGAVLRVGFDGGTVNATYRYVQSAGFQDEEAADAYLYRGYGSVAPGPMWQRWQQQYKNVANTSVMALPDRLLSLWEGGLPHALDLDSLETRGIDNLGELSPNCTYSAHPKRDPITGEIFNFGLVAGANSVLNLYRCDRNGKVIKQAALDLNGIPLIHDSVLAGPYWIFAVPPVRLNALPAVLGLRSFSDALMWQPRRGTQIFVIDRDSLELVSLEQTDPWFQWHFGRGTHNLDGTVSIDLVRYPDFSTNQHLKEVASGQVHTSINNGLWQLQLKPQTATVTAADLLVDKVCEFPVLAGEHTTYLSCHSGEHQGELFDAIARFDAHTRQLTIAPAGPGCYPSEPIYAADAENPDQGWLITVVYSGPADRSEVWIYDCDRIDDGPVCRLVLPQIIPHSFHGTWAAAASS